MLLFSLVTGVFWGTWFSLSRSIAAITPTTFLEVGHIMIGNLGGPMALLILSALLCTVGLGVWLYRRQQTLASTFTGGVCTAARVADHHARRERTDRWSDPVLDDRNATG